MSGPSKNKGKGRGLQWLLANVEHGGDECLIWPMSKSGGYGNVGINGKHYWAHRYMCELAYGPPPSSEYEAAHYCGRGLEGCCNPRHLSWKTRSENQLDRSRHGTRNAHGSGGRLTQEMVDQIRGLRGVKTQPEIAQMFGITKSTVSAVMIGRTWTGKIKGVRRQGAKWGAKLRFDGRERWLGTFNTKEEAHNAYLIARKRAIHGDEP